MAISLSLSLSLSAGEDFTNDPLTVTIAPMTSGGQVELRVRQFFNVTDDDIFEHAQSFALVAVLGSEVPDKFACFRVRFSDDNCHGRIGATHIVIRDRDGNNTPHFSRNWVD